MQNTQMSDEMRDSAKHAASGVRTAGRVAKKLYKSKLGKAARKGLHALWTVLPIPVKLGLIGVLVIFLIFIVTLTSTPALISNASFHQNDPESLSDGHDIGYYGTAEEDIELIKSVAESVDDVISKVLDDSVAEAKGDLETAAEENDWTIDWDEYTPPTETESDRQRVMLYSEYSASVHNELNDASFTAFQETTAKRDVEKKLRALINQSNETYPYGNKLNGADFKRNEDGTVYIREETVSDDDGDYTIYYVTPIVYAPEYDQVAEDAFLADGITSESPYVDETHDEIEGLSDEALASIYGTYSDAAVRMSRILGEILYGENFWGNAAYDFTLNGPIFGRSNQDVVNFALNEYKLDPQVGGEKYCSEFGWPVGTAWCALFVSYCMKQCGYVDSGIFTPSASCAAFYNDFVARGIWHPRASGYMPKAGDVILFHWKNSDYAFSHTGIVVSCDGTYVYTIEGNTSNQVHPRTYPVNSSDIVGYGTPDYPVIEGEKTDDESETDADIKGEEAINGSENNAA